MAFLQIGDFSGVALHSVCHGFLPQRIPGGGVVVGAGNERQHIGGSMGMELPGAKVQGPIQAVIEQGVMVEIRQFDGVDAGGVFQDRFPVVSLLPAFHELAVLISGRPVGQAQGVEYQGVGQPLAQLHGPQPTGIWLPHPVIVNEPLLPLRHITGLFLIPVGEQVSVADVIPGVAVVFLRV